MELYKNNHNGGAIDQMVVVQISLVHNRPQGPHRTIWSLSSQLEVAPVHFWLWLKHTNTMILTCYTQLSLELELWSVNEPMELKH